MIKKYFLFAVVVLLIIFLYYQNNKHNDLPIINSFYDRSDFYDNAYNIGRQNIPNVLGHVYAGIIPHHLIVADKIAGYFLGLEKYKYDKIVVISPNHFNVGWGDIIITNYNWKTPYGILYSDQDLALKIKKVFPYNIDVDSVQAEHGIGNEAPYVVKSFPKATFLGIMVRDGASKEDLDLLAQKLFDNSNHKKILILASVDFSHNSSIEIADQRDKKSNQIIQSLDLNKFNEISADCPSALYVVTKYSQIVGTYPQLIWNTNSGRIVGVDSDTTTSHNFYYFFK
jgi:poly-gamma-glutamate synthesis protein (capsule biosynthesis protein)